MFDAHQPERFRFNACAVPHFLLPGNIDFVVMSVWSQNETLALVELWRDEDVEAQLEDVHRNLAVYNRLAELLSIRGYERTGKQLL